jgi:hypothetical protein
MNRYIIAVIWKTCDQLWNPKLENLQIWKTCDQLWNPKLENLQIWKTCDQLWNPKSLKSPKLENLGSIVESKISKI